jgi:hypothetical protein
MRFLQQPRLVLKRRGKVVDAKISVARLRYAIDGLKTRNGGPCNEADHLQLEDRGPGKPYTTLTW